ncbi:MAG: hypothetical protein A2X59_08380 [Nitrospirae bacterium GWC2_42_7]|nr:MAG: hypothetical protein A2X59_08380 [Nitrospirae bacterium GWC2_42_7]
MKTLSRLMKSFENAMAATAFAEEGEFETAREIMNEGNRQGERISGRVDSKRTKPTLRARGGK